jgi:DMSO/TMAO reductase YedYZ molybdopterin-dependent catalytic subunit
MAITGSSIPSSAWARCTSKWTGVPLRNLVELVGVDRTDSDHRGRRTMTRSIRSGPERFS